MAVRIGDAEQVVFSVVGIPRTNHPLERLLREVRRRTRAVGAFPDGKSALMLAAARLRHVAGTKWGTRRYLDMNRLSEASEAA